MAINKQTLAAAKNYTNMVCIGITNMYVQDTTVHFTVAETGEEVSVTLPLPKDGKSLEFDWQDTKLGVRAEGDTNYKYVDLKGQEGMSPTAKVEKIDKTTTITIVDKNGTTTADVLDGSIYPTSDSKPVDNGNVGDIVFNTLPQPGDYVGWVFTHVGWFGFGLIEDVDSVNFVLSDGSLFLLSDGSPFLLYTNS